MHLRKDALAAAAQWICDVEQIARQTEGLVATVGRLTLQPGAVNVIAGEARATLDIRHAQDSIRQAAAKRLIERAHSIAADRGMTAEWQIQAEQAAVWMDADLTRLAADAIRQAGIDPVEMVSGAGHDAMILAERVPATMIFLRSPGGISHNPSESVRPQDVENALAAGYRFLEIFEARLMDKKRQAQDG
jgi:allantoate deiminase